MSDLVPPDFERCQTDRPSTWPEMPSAFTLGPVSWKRCVNAPTWVATEIATGGSMTLCDECKSVMGGLFSEDEVKVAALAGVDR